MWFNQKTNLDNITLDMHQQRFTSCFQGDSKTSKDHNISDEGNMFSQHVKSNAFRSRDIIDVVD